MRKVSIAILIGILTIALVALLIAAAAAAVYTAGVYMEHVPQPPKKNRKHGRRFGRLRYWLFYDREIKQCKACCLWCKYYESCLYDVSERETSIALEKERDSRNNGA